MNQDLYLKIKHINKMGLIKEVIKEIGNKSREFYEFVLPPIDMHLNNENLKVVIDIPGFSKKDIELSLCGDILSIKAKKVIDEKDSKTLISNQRPNMINKKVRLPIEIKEGEEKIESAKYQNGVLVLVIPVTKKSKNITIE